MATKPKRPAGPVWLVLALLLCGMAPTNVAAQQAISTLSIGQRARISLRHRPEQHVRSGVVNPVAVVALFFVPPQPEGKCAIRKCRIPQQFVRGMPARCSDS
jgi:hypothetical protein